MKLERRITFDRLRDDIETVVAEGTSSDRYRLRDLLYGEYVRLKGLCLREAIDKAKEKYDLQRV